MIYLVNISTVILAAVFALQLSSEKKAYTYSIVSILIGLAFHAFEAYLNKTQGKCEFSETTSIINSIDNCIKYESGTMLFAQAAILAGFTVIFIKLATKSKPKPNK